MTDSLSFEKGIYIFNPDTDFALASGSKFYTPPSSVISLRHKMGAIPAIYAPENSAILLLDRNDKGRAYDDKEIRKCIEAKKIVLLAPEELKQFHDQHPDMHFFPWGWNPAIRHSLLENGAHEDMLPTETDIAHIRRLSHRRLTIAANIAAIGKGIASPDALPQEFTDERTAKLFLQENPGAWFKAPWSSSGRGVINSSELHPEETMQWIRGTIHRQGSVMGETSAEKKYDFASEWMLSSRHGAAFVGLSVFETSNRGKYKRNIPLPFDALWDLFSNNSIVHPETIIGTQREFLKSEVAPFYNGPVGIDMMVGDGGTTRPFVEINLRMTMGIVALFQNIAMPENLSDRITHKK